MPLRSIANEDAVLLSHQLEDVEWGTAPTPFTPVALLGVATDWEILLDDNPESYKSGQSYTPTGRFTRQREYAVRFGYMLIDDNPTNSLIAYGIGSAPDAGTGAITNWFNTTDRDLRSFTIQAGVNRPNKEQYYRVRGCKIRRLEIDWNFRQREVDVKVDAVARYFDKQQAVYGTVPQPSPLAVFDPVADNLITFSNPTISDVILREAQLIFENQMIAESVVRSGSTGDKSIGIAQPINPRCTLRLTNLRDREAFLTQYLAARGTAAAEVDVTLQLSKNAAAEFVKFTLSDCELMDPYRLGWTRDPEVQRESLTLEAKSWAVDVKTP